jgi:predicted TIM-barrel fold metal-dependent hydrolase
MRRRHRFLRRGLLASGLAVVAGVLALHGCVSTLGGASRRRPDELRAGLSPRASAAIAAAWSGLDPAKIIDVHTHLMGTGAGGTGNFVNPFMLSWCHPFRHMEYKVLTSAAGIADAEHADEQYVARLVSLARNIENHGKYCLLALDRNYRRDGEVDLEKTTFYVPDDYAYAVAEKYPDVFEPAMSIHPYRRDALAEMDTFAKRGGRLIKWLPNGMGIDPADPVCEPFYDRMKELGLILLTHAGEEKAVEAATQDLGNPLRLRAALDRGVRVIVAHCASLGEDEDLDAPGKPLVSSFRLFLRLMETKKYEGLLFGDISAMTLANRCGNGSLETILNRTDLHSRLINGSDYPLPAANILLRTGKLESLGFITAEERALLNEIYDYNPLLLDFMVKRLIRAPGTGVRLADGVFMDNPGLQRERR